MFKFRILVAILSFFIQQKSYAQTPIQLDRPDQTECPFIVPVSYLQVENGFVFEKIDKESKSISYPSTLWKLGITESLELRLVTELVAENANQEMKKEIKKGIMPIAVGFKVKIAEEKGLIPSTAFIGHLTMPNSSSKHFDINHQAPSFRFTMQHSLSKRISLAYNLGAEWNGETPHHTFIYTFTTGFSITEQLGSYIEMYGFKPQNQALDNRLDGGFTYLINNDMMADISGGLGITKNAPKGYISFGFSFRFNTKRTQ